MDITATITAVENISIADIRDAYSKVITAAQNGHPESAHRALTTANTMRMNASTRAYDETRVDAVLAMSAYAEM